MKSLLKRAGIYENENEQDNMEEIEVFIEDTFDVTESEDEDDQSDNDEGRSSKNVDPSRAGQSEKDATNTNTA